MITAMADKAAFEQLFHRYWRVLVVYARKIVPNQEDAEDMVQEAFTQLWNHRETIESDKHANNFLYLAVRGRSTSLLRNQRARRKLNQLAAIEQEIQEAAQEFDLEWITAQLTDIIGKLPPDQRRAVLKRVERGKQHGLKSNNLGPMTNGEYVCISRARRTILKEIAVRRKTKQL